MELRLCPPVSMVTRKCISRNVVGSITVPKSMDMVVPASHLRRSPKFWDPSSRGRPPPVSPAAQRNASWKAPVWGGISPGYSSHKPRFFAPNLIRRGGSERPGCLQLRCAKQPCHETTETLSDKECSVSGWLPFFRKSECNWRVPGDKNVIFPESLQLFKFPLSLFEPLAFLKASAWVLIFVSLWGSNPVIASETGFIHADLHPLSSSLTRFDDGSSPYVLGIPNNLTTAHSHHPTEAIANHIQPEPAKIFGFNTSNGVYTVSESPYLNPDLVSTFQSVRDWIQFFLGSIFSNEEVEPSRGNCATCIGNVDDTLASCGLIPNCVSSFDDRPAFFIPPWEYEGSLSDALNSLKLTIVSSNGVVREEGERYVYATFTEGNHTDDVEFIFGKFESDRTVNIHSASRSINRPDWGTNSKRLEGLRFQLGWNEVPILRNRNRLFIVLESPWDTFGPEPPPTIDFNDIELD